MLGAKEHQQRQLTFVAKQVFAHYGLTPVEACETFCKAALGRSFGLAGILVSVSVDGEPDPFKIVTDAHEARARELCNELADAKNELHDAEEALDAQALESKKVLGLVEAARDKAESQNWQLVIRSNDLQRSLDRVSAELKRTDEELTAVNNRNRHAKELLEGKPITFLHGTDRPRQRYAGIVG